jgi:hypothetical protein
VRPIRLPVVDLQDISVGIAFALTYFPKETCFPGCRTDGGKGSYQPKIEGHIMMGNSVAHFEICADDPDKPAKLYTSLFDWTIQPVPNMDYRWIRTMNTDD